MGQTRRFSRRRDVRQSVCCESLEPRLLLSATVHGDFNNDGFEDLAIGVPGEDIGAQKNAGAVNVIYGSATGLRATTAGSTPANQFLSQNTPNIVGPAETGDKFGSSLAVGDFNNDGFEDLAIGAPGEAIGTVKNAGAVNVIYGSATGLRATAAGSTPASRWWVQQFEGVKDNFEAGDNFGSSLIAGDFNNDGFEDLAIGVSGEDIGTQKNAGAVSVIYGSATGLRATAAGSTPTNQFWSQDTANIMGPAEAGDNFGSSLAVGDFNNDGFEDLAIGVPGEAIGTVKNAGAVNVIYGSATGLRATAAGSTPASRWWVQQFSGVMDDVEAGDNFGSSLAVGDFNNDGFEDLAIGVPGEDIGAQKNAGAVNAIYGSATGLRATAAGSTPANQFWSQNTANMLGGTEAGDNFGSGDLVGTVEFAVIGDYGWDGPNEQAVADLVKSWDPDFVITVGDNNYSFGEAATIDANIGKYYKEFIGNDAAGIGSGSLENRFFPALGNHDWATMGAQPYLDYFDLPGAGFSSTSSNERYYDFVQGPVHFFVIDSDVHEPDGNSSTSVQAQWLRQQLAASTSVYDVVYFHDAPYSSSVHGSNAVLQWPFKQWGAEVILSGHDHTYERIDVDGLPYFVNGLGGRSIYNFNTPVAGSQARYNNNYGAMLVTADDSSMTLEFYSVAGGTLVDTFTIAAVTDRTSPTASLTTPFDNSSRDVDPTVGAVTTGFSQATFEIQLADDQTSIDDASVTASSVTITRNSVTLVEGVDYTFTYDVTSDLITLKASQLFDQATYKIQVSGIQDRSANVITPTALDVIIDRARATSFSIVMLPDTQHYSQDNPAIFYAQTQWVADHVATDNLVFLTHMGDLVQTGSIKAEWDVADTAMATLDGVIPYAVAPGNHDYDRGGLGNSPPAGPVAHPAATLFVEDFGASRYAGYSWYGGSSADQLNHYQVFDAGGFQILHIALEFEPRNSALAWAQSVIDAHPELPVVLSTHAYLTVGNRRWQPSQNATFDGNSGEDIFQKLVRPNQQVFMVLSGHAVGVEARNIATNDFGQDVLEIQCDFQFARPNGGNGLMRLMEFFPNENRIDVSTYSPTLDQFESDANSQFSLDINFAERFNFT